MHDTKTTLGRRLTAIKSQRSSGELEELALIIGAPPRTSAKTHNSELAWSAL